ncbi:uncharacterized protein LOC142860942 [Microcebus murinus]|uniref:uncharacterized protein LOC142860942 n=1 Tax=Microcebus murinus TaxID=30608 RepID=UPI003F6CCB28
MFQQSCVAESRASGLLKEKDPEPLSQQPQATSSGNKEALSPPVTLEYLPFFCTYGWLAEEEMGLQPEVCTGKAGSQSLRFAPFPEDSALPDGFFPYYCSQEESFPSLVLPTWTCGGSQDSPSRREARAGCFYRTTIRDGCSATLACPDLISGSSHSPACHPVPLVSAGQHQDSIPDASPCGGHSLYAAGFIPYYRSPEEGLRTSPGPPTSPPRSQQPPGLSPRPGAVTLRRSRSWLQWEPLQNRSPAPTI